MPLQVGDQIPSFSLLDQTGKYRTDKEFRGNTLVLFFYPKDDTSGCTIETNDFNKLLNKFKKFDCVIYGVSKDSLESHRKWSKKLKLKFDLLSDEKKISIKGYKVWTKKKFMGREFMGTVRSTFLINNNFCFL